MISYSGIWKGRGKISARDRRWGAPRHDKLKYAVAALLTFQMAAGSYAEEAKPAATSSEAKNGIPPDSIATSLPDNGDPSKIRAKLAQNGITFIINYTGEVLGNPAGGEKRGTIYDGLLEFVGDADLEKLAGLKGLGFHFNIFEIHGRGLAKNYVRSLETISNIEALPNLRLSELWFEQKILDGKGSVRIGQLTQDSEFIISDYGSLFINADWPTITKADLPSGGAAYPLSTPGVRLKLEPSSHDTFLIGLYNGDPAGPGKGDPEERNPNGLAFRLNDPPLIIGEWQHKYNQEKEAPGLKGTVKFGGWYHFGEFNDQRFASNGLSIANPASTGIPAKLRGDWGAYGVIDQQIWKLPGAEDKGVGFFLRVSASPTDRNLIDAWAEGGLVFSGLVPHRPDDSFGGSVIYSHLSDRGAALDRDSNAFLGKLGPIRDFEALYSLTYRYQVVPGFNIQPTFEYVVHPSANFTTSADSNGTKAVPDAAIIGVRTTLRY